MHWLFDVAVSVLFRWGVALGPHSGQNRPPMFGDYEAQRHWMEITFNLPIKDWYFNTSDNDLLYWGLDYPPLTAFHSYAMGAVAHRCFNSSWVELHRSRGTETYKHRLFMRYSVLLADLLLYIPAVIVFVKHVLRPKNENAKHVLIIALLTYPGLILIDYGHFQYNCVSLGLFLLAVIAIFGDLHCVASALFVCALNYKQMELYHALPFFCYLLAVCLRKTERWSEALLKLFGIALSTVVSFAVCWSPFLSDLEQMKVSVLPFLVPFVPTYFKQILNRLFPFYRGLYEDKVANVWCSLSVLVKWKEWFEIATIIKLCAVVTFALLIPSCAVLFRNPSKRQFKLALINSSLVFFLFSFQVHEKSILLVAVPVLLCVCDSPLACIWFLLHSVISMYPLFVKDNIEIAFYALTVPWYICLSDVFSFGLLKRPGVIRKGRKAKIDAATSECTTLFARIDLRLCAFHLTVLFGLMLCLAKSLLNPPERYPYLFDWLISAYCCAMFCLFCVIAHYWQYLACQRTSGKLKIN